jgi:hypothetical protein
LVAAERRRENQIPARAPATTRITIAPTLPPISARVCDEVGELLLLLAFAPDPEVLLALKTELGGRTLAGRVG